MSFGLHASCLLRCSSKKCFLWLYGPTKTKLQSTLISQISSRFVSMKPHMPKIFSGKPRSLLEAKMRKATEFGQFLLYTGPVVLLDKLKSALYRNFLLLLVSLRVLLAPDVYSLDNKYKQELIFTFVQNFSRLYGKFVLTYNVQSLLHIVDDYALFGNLDNVSCFPFENFFGCLKKMVRKPSVQKKGF